MTDTSSATGIRPVAPTEHSVMAHVARPADGRALRVMPVADSILWSPTIGGSHRPAPLIFFAQHTLRKIHERLVSVPNGLGMGLLAGRRFTCSRSGAQFVIIDGALPLPALAAEDEPIERLADGMSSAAAGIEIFGWYRGHSFSDAALTPADVDAQAELFGDRPCIVVVVAAGGEAGAVFRHSSSPAWPVEALPFYEWVGEPAVGADGPKATLLSWRNYRSSEPVVRLAIPAGAAAAERSHQPLVIPDGDPDDDTPYLAPAPAGKAVWFRRFVRPALYGVCALAGALLVTGLSAVIRSGNGASGGSRADHDSAINPAAAGTAAVLDRRADTLALALTAFSDRMQMFDARQMTCTGLSRGLQQVEEGWVGYNIARKETLTSFNASREARDRSLYADVRSVERRYERSGCARP